MVKIGEVSEKYGLSVDTLRYYERIGLLPPVNRNASGVRDFSDLDVRRVEFIKCMRSAGLPLEVLTEYMHLALEGDDTIEARKAILVEQRDQLTEKVAAFQETLDLLNHKIRIYEERLIKKEQKLTELEELSIETE